MEEVKTDVEAVESSTTEPSEGDVQASETSEAEETVSQPTTEVETNVETVPPVGIKQEVEAVDDTGVPWKNRAMETQRKLEKVTKNQEEILEKVSSLSQAQQKPQYTIEQLEEFAANSDTSESHRLWAMKEIRGMEEQKMATVVRSEFDRREQIAQTEQYKKESLSQVMQRHPDAFVKNQAGQIVSWNTSSPLTQKIGEYMNDPEIANNPRGLIVASALAYQDLSTINNAKTNQKIQSLKNEAGSLKKKTLIEGGTNADIKAPSQRQVAIEKSKSGNPKDAVDAMKELWKATGRLQE